MKSLIAALALVAGACVAFGPDEAEARQRSKPGCTTPKFETPIAPPVQYVAPPLQQIVSPPTVVETPPQTVTIPGQTITLPPTTVTVPGQAITLPGAAYTLQQTPLMPYAAPICPDEQPKASFLQRFREQRKLKREKHLGIEEAAAAPEQETSAACKRCKKRIRGWYDEPLMTV